MVDYLAAYCQRGSVLEEFRALKAEADAHYRRELGAATDIQRYFRGFVDRRTLRRAAEKAACIQRCFRGFFSGVMLARLTEMNRQREQLAFYHYMARIIQKAYRGYYSRKYTHDFYSRKRYINQVIDQGNSLKLQLTEHIERQLEDAYKREIEKQRDEFDHVTANLHHLVSTKAQPGVYNSPYLLDQNITSFGIPIEETLIEQSRRLARSRVATLRRTNNSESASPPVV